MWACCSATPIVPYTNGASEFSSPDIRRVSIKTKPSGTYQEMSNNDGLLPQSEQEASQRELHYRVDEVMIEGHTSDMDWFEEIQSFCRFLDISLQKRSQNDSIGTVNVLIQCSAENQKNHVSIQYTGPSSQLARILLKAPGTLDSAQLKQLAGVVTDLRNELERALGDTLFDQEACLALLYMVIVSCGLQETIEAVGISALDAASTVLEGVARCLCLCCCADTSSWASWGPTQQRLSSICLVHVARLGAQIDEMSVSSIGRDSSLGQVQARLRSSRAELASLLSTLVDESKASPLPLLVCTCSLWVTEASSSPYKANLAAHLRRFVGETTAQLRQLHSTMAHSADFGLWTKAFVSAVAVSLQLVGTGFSSSAKEECSLILLCGSMVVMMIDSLLLGFVSPDVSSADAQCIIERYFAVATKEMLLLYRHHLQATQDQSLRRPIEQMWLLIAAKAQQCTAVLRSATSSLLVAPDGCVESARPPVKSEPIESVLAATLHVRDVIATPAGAQQPEPEAESWKEGDLVEGLYRLSDGSSRYYAGKLIAVALNQGIVSIRYDDGEEQLDKPVGEIRVPKAVMMKRRLELKKKGLNPGALRIGDSGKSRTAGLSSPEQDKGGSTPPRPSSGIRVLQPPAKSVSPQTRKGSNLANDRRASKPSSTWDLPTGESSTIVAALSSGEATETAPATSNLSVEPAKALFPADDVEVRDHAEEEDDDGSVLDIPAAFESDPEHQSALRKSYSDSGLVPAILMRSASGGSTAGLTLNLSQSSLLGPGSPGAHTRSFHSMLTVEGGTGVESSVQPTPPFVGLGDDQRGCVSILGGDMEGAAVTQVRKVLESLRPEEQRVRHQHLLALCASLSGVMAHRATTSAVLEESEKGDVGACSIVDTLDVSVCLPQPLSISLITVPSEQAVPFFAVPSVDEGQSDLSAAPTLETKINLTFSLRELLEAGAKSNDRPRFSCMVEETIRILDVSVASRGGTTVEKDDAHPAMRLLLLSGLGPRPVQHIPCLEAHLSVSQRSVGLPRYNSAGRARGKSARTPVKDKGKSPTTLVHPETSDEPRLSFLGKGGFATIHAGYCAATGSTAHCCRESAKALCKQGCFAVKRQRREHRSTDLLPALVDVFAEVSCLQRLSRAQCTGACQIYGYGVIESDGILDDDRRGMPEEAGRLRRPSEYVLVLELGGITVADWRCQLTSVHVAQSLATAVQRGHRHVPGRTGELSRSLLDMALSLLLLELYMDMLLVTAQVHQAAVLHFDIKAANFLFADISRLVQLASASQTLEPENDLLGLLLQLWPMMRTKHQQGLPSGVLLLCDFGEGLCLHPSKAGDSPSSELCPPSLSRCRGTLPIQAPEFIALTSTRKSDEENQQAHDEPTLNSHRSSPFTVAGPDIGSGPHSNFASARGPETGRSANSTTSSVTLGSAHPPYGVSGVTGSAEGGASRHVLPFPKSYPSYAADVWSLGCLLVEVLTGEMLLADKVWSELYVHLCTSAGGGGSAPGASTNATMAARSASNTRYLHWAEAELLIAEGAGPKAQPKLHLHLSLPLLRQMFILVEGGVDGFFSDHADCASGGMRDNGIGGEESKSLAPSREALHTLIETVLNTSLQRLPQCRVTLNGLIATMASFFEMSSGGLAHLGIAEAGKC